MNSSTLQNLLSDASSAHDEMHHVMYIKEKEYERLPDKVLQSHLISEANWMMRKEYRSCDQLGVRIEIGDICYIDFGQAYLNEAGFQHFGLILNVFNGKAFVVPMTSNPSTYAQAYDEFKQPHGKKHLMRIGLVKGLNRESVLFLNDCKYINTARIIDVKARIPQNSALFQKIRERVMNCLIQPESSTILP
ncbi:MAG: type II toxin-antitoxin system PemK/MazF family toxin [Erysipelotrichaceae bacterium]|nr:type II toxin-antitoxin system PemK/MazF family toxin [Erysipelotrichaceae bacterium]